MKTCDLHTHSTFSDGSLTPYELVKRASAAGLSALALTDHNTSKGLPDFTAAASESGIIAVPGCEFSTDYEGTELHIVGLFFPEETWSEIEDYVDLYRIAKSNSNKKLIRALQDEGYPVTFDEVRALSGSDNFNRSHIARLLVGKGIFADTKEAFSTILNETNGLYVPPRRLGALMTVRFIRSYGGRAVLAHPLLNLSYDGLERFLPAAKEEGLNGIETLYSTFDDEMTAGVRALATRFGLLESGGSDFHGAAKPDIEIGTGRGNLRIPFSFYEALRDCK